MLDELVEESLLHLEENFYKKDFYFSYSSLNKLLYNPMIFYQMYIVGIREERLDKHLVEGKLIHCLLLDNGNFENQFIISPDNLPTGTTRSIIDAVYRHHCNCPEPKENFEDYSDKILEIMREINFFQKLVDDKKDKTLTGDSKRLSKVITDETKNAWEFYKKKGNKTLIDQATLYYCENAVEIIKKTPNILELIGDIETFGNIEVLNEQHFQTSLEGRPFGIQGIIDNLVIDHDKKIIRINDLKTTSKPLSSFPESVEYWNYWLQGILYLHLVMGIYEDLMKQGYDIEFRFIVIDQEFQVYPFLVSDKTIKEWYFRYVEVLDMAQYHYDNRRFQLPYKFDKGEVIL